MSAVARPTTANHWGSYRANLRNGKIATLDPLSSGDEVSAVTPSMLDTLDSPSRLRTPCIREGWLRSERGRTGDRRGSDRFVQVTWDEALDILAGELLRIRQTYGNDAIFAGSYGWASAGRFHHAQSQLHRFYNLFGGYVRSVNTYSHAAADVILPHILCDLRRAMAEGPSWLEIAESTDLLVAFGGMGAKNTQMQPGGVGEHTFRKWMRRLAAEGRQCINVSPIRDDLADELDGEWLPIRPNTDTALMLALGYWLDANGHVDHDFLDRYCTGYERFRPYLLGETDGVAKTPDWAARITGVPADTISDLAERLTRGRTLINVSWSLQRAHAGEQPYWMAVTLAAMLGQIGLPGGGVAIGLGAVHGNGDPQRHIGWAGLPQGVNKVRGFIPVARIADMLLNPGGAYRYNGGTHTYPQIRLIHWAGGNPFHHHQDLHRLRQAWARPDTVVAQEIFWNGLARHADIVLPATSPMERNDFAAGNLDSWAVAMKRVSEPPHGARNDHDIFAGLAERLGFGVDFTEGRDEMGWLQFIWARSQEQATKAGVDLPAFDDFWRDGSVALTGGPYVRRFLGAFRDDPEANPLTTPSGRIEIYSETIASFGDDGIPGHPFWSEPYEWLGNTARYPLHLITNQPRTRLHSQLDHGAASRRSKVAGREPVRINPGDAAVRGISGGDVVRLFNDRGECLAGAVLDEAVMRGVLQLSTGAWLDLETPGAERSLERHGNPNVLTADRGTSAIAQGPTAHTCLVEIERFDCTPPAVKAFEPPEIIGNTS